MEECDDVLVAASIESLELGSHPRELRRVFGDVRVEPQHERIAVPERERRISGEPSWRAVWWNQLRHRVEVVPQSDLPARCVELCGRRDVVIPRREEIGNPPVSRES